MPAAAALPALLGIGSKAMQALPLITGGLGALEGLKTGGLLGGLAGGGLGYFGGKVGQPYGKRLAGQAVTAAPGIASALGAQIPVDKALQLGALAGTGLVAGVAAPAVARLAGQIGSGAANIVGAPLQGLMGGAGNLVQSGAGILGYRPDGSPIYGGQAVPGGMGQYGPTDPYGSPLDVLGPTGMGRRLETVKSAEAQRDAMRMLLPEVYKATEATKKSDFERQAAMKGIAQNIATRAAMLQNAQAAGLQMGGTAAQQAGQALTQLYQYQ
jgi:hypothetical protein